MSVVIESISGCMQYASVERTEFLWSAKDDEAYEGVLWGLAGAAHSKSVIRGRTTLSLLYRYVPQYGPLKCR